MRARTMSRSRSSCLERSELPSSGRKMRSTRMLRPVRTPSTMPVCSRVQPKRIGMYRSVIPIVTVATGIVSEALGVRARMSRDLRRRMVEMRDWRSRDHLDGIVIASGVCL